uniref:Uncharacterized protein n=1 Tax=Anguilla anguilla TaxID=7936 RepID=A0A0E9R2R6_ANGAN
MALSGMYMSMYMSKKVQMRLFKNKGNPEQISKPALYSWLPHHLSE